MQTKNTTNSRAFFNGLNLFKPFLLAGVLTLSFNINADEDFKYWTVVGMPKLFNGLEYGVIKSPRTRRVWLDRNLGAARTCVVATDETCYGHFYQWGRAKDGHELRTSETAIADVRADNITPGTNTFYIGPTYSNFDWTTKDKRGNERADAWKDGGVNDICPPGYSVPTIYELKEDIIDAGINNAEQALWSGLRIPASGYRHYSDGIVKWTNQRLALWSSTPYWSNYGTAPWAGAMYLSHNAKWSRNDNRAYGFNVRCIRDL